MTPGRAPQRLLSLDAFRGLTIAGMIVVNNPGSWSAIYPPLGHAPWHGWTPTDLVFPFFLFIVGVAIPFSLANRAAAGATRGQVTLRILRRAAVLVALGLFLRAFPKFDFATMRIPGVLQRIGLVYLGAALLVSRTGVRAQAAWAGGLLLGYWALLAFVPVPGFGAGVLDKKGNLAAYVDIALLRGHLYEPEWDPEGLLSTLPAIATALLGALAGHWLRSERSGERKSAGLLAAGVAAAVVGWVWSAALPINKNLWTSSYSVFTAGLALLGLGFCHWVADVNGIRRWTKPFVVFGVNSIAAFFLSSLVAKCMGLLRVAGPDGGEISLKTWIWREVFAPLGPPRAASLAFALAFLLLFLGLMSLLYRRRIFLKV